MADEKPCLVDNENFSGCILRKQGIMEVTFIMTRLETEE
jgi:hypothetical protein